MFGRLALLLLWVAASRTKGSEENDVTPGLRSGILFQPKGPLVLATGTWTAIVRFQQEDVERQSNQIREQFTKIDRALENSGEFEANQTAEEQRTQQFIREMKAMWNQERTWMEAELRAGEVEIQELRTELRLSRRARGLINALGDGLKWLFGTATETDVQKLHKQIEGITAGVGKLHHIAELQTTLIGEISKRQKNNDKHLVTLARKAIELESLFTVTRDADHITMRNIRRELDFGHAISSAIRTASAAVMTFHHEVRQISRAMAHTQQGVVTPAILSPATLKTTMAAITNHLPDGWVPAISLSETPANIYKFLEISAVALEDGWEVHIQIPLQYRPYGQYHLFKVNSIPTHFSNSSIALEAQVPYPYFAISKDQRLHIELSAEEISRCRHVGGRTMCNKLTPLIKEKREGCLYHAFRDEESKVEEECVRKMIKPKPQIYPVADNKWLYVLPTEELFSMQCAGEGMPTKGFRLQGTGIFSLPASCTAMGDHYIIPAHLKRQGDTPAEMKLTDMTHFKIELKPSTFQNYISTKGRINQTELNEILEAAKETDREDSMLTELKETMKNWNESPDTEGISFKLINHTSLTLGGVALLGVLGLLAYNCSRNRRPQSTIIQPCQNPDLSIPSAPLLPDPSQISQLQSRIHHLEVITTDLQCRMEKTAQLEIALAKLKKQHDELTALL
ncbi:uncharacterized protein LOC122363836 [Amphibalanus amphitrite]|uniref:uncharacterized protein LOC122363836 n=1 Tax=Amphibalanus amphitrite TaxID=1232801 RepID=UPI001C92149A|nr:uncharacterized protein LOC122363836 [Amphibalanus amphitrite]